MVQQSIEIFDNPITVTDKELKVLAVNFWDTQANGQPGWTIESGHTVPPEIVAQVRDIYQQGKKKQTELQWFDYNELPGQEERVFRVNVLHGGLYEGCVSLTENRRSFRPGDFVLLQNFAEYIKKALQKLTLINSESLISTRAMLKNLLDCIPVDVNRLQQALQMDARASPTLPEQWVCLKLHISTPEQIHSVEHVRVALENALPGARAIIHDSEPVVFLPDDNQEKLTLYLNAAVSALTGLNIQIGVSFSFQNITAARIYYRQACCALETGIQIAPRKKIYRFEEMLIPYMLIHSRGEFDYDSILTKDLVKLRQYSHDHAADYWKTLRVYLDNEMNAAQTAKDLYLSRSTLLLRLERINKLLGVSLQTARERLYIRICLHMRDCLTASENGDSPKE